MRAPGLVLGRPQRLPGRVAGLVRRTATARAAIGSVEPAMKTTRPVQVPDPLPLRDALQQSAPLARLRERIDGSNARFRAIQAHLPRAMAGHVKPGPLDDESWALLAPNGAVAAKLRQLQPVFESALRDAGWPPRTIRIKVLG
jgi:hypothetical protein